MFLFFLKKRTAKRSKKEQQKGVEKRTAKRSRSSF
jgi:hypothetical protein